MGKLTNKRLFLLDMDGTIYLDYDLFDGTLDFLNKVKEIGGRYLFLTNNSSKGAKAYVEKLKKIGIEEYHGYYHAENSAKSEEALGPKPRYSPPVQYFMLWREI